MFSKKNLNECEFINIPNVNDLNLKQNLYESPKCDEIIKKRCTLSIRNSSNGQSSIERCDMVKKIN